MTHIRLRRIVSLILAAATVFSAVGCASSPPGPTLSGSGQHILAENIETEQILYERELNEFISSEVYLEEIVIAEEKITELLLEEETISEVLLCKTIYVPQSNLDEFAENSQTNVLFGNADIKPLLKKIAIGSGVIITLVVLKKVGFPEPIASMVASAADQAEEFAGKGLAIGTLFGGLSGTADAVDQSGRTTAVMGFALATVGLVLSIVSLVAAVPSGGATAITLGEGVNIGLAGLEIILTSVGTVKTGRNAVKAFTATDYNELDWSNIDWEKAGESAARESISGAANGYMWGAIFGGLNGAAEGLVYYEKFNTPYTKYKFRIDHTPADGPSGHWTGKRGESDFVLKKPIKLPGGKEITKITYKNGVPDFSPFQKARVRIKSMTNQRSRNFGQADEVLAKEWTRTRFGGKTWTRTEVAAYRAQNNLTWHEMSNMESMQLVPTELNNTFLHSGGVSEYNAMIGEEATVIYD